MQLDVPVHRPAAELPQIRKLRDDYKTDKLPGETEIDFLYRKIQYIQRAINDLRINQDCLKEGFEAVTSFVFIDDPDIDN